jgi:hypothetical protein
VERQSLTYPSYGNIGVGALVSGCLSGSPWIPSFNVDLGELSKYLEKSLVNNITPIMAKNISALIGSPANNKIIRG